MVDTNSGDTPRLMEVVEHTPSDQQVALALARNSLGAQLSVAAFVASLGIERDELAALMQSKHFKQMVAAYRAELQKDNEGVKLKAAIALEDCLPVLHKIAQNERTTGLTAVAAIKELREISGVSRQEAVATGGGSGFSLTIDLSGLAAAGVAANKSQEGKTVIDIQAERDE